MNAEATRLYFFLKSEGIIETIIVSDKTNILEHDTYTSQNCDPDEFYSNLVEYLDFLSETIDNITCVLKLRVPFGNDIKYSLLTPTK